MLLDERLRTGELGVRYALPSHLEGVSTTFAMLSARDHATALDWRLVFDPDARLDLAPAHRSELARSLEHYARWAFDERYAYRRRHDETRASCPPPRSADPTWPAMIDVEHVVVDGAPALCVAHHAILEPGCHAVTGYLWIPVRDGLFEIRIEGDALPGDDARDAQPSDPLIARVRAALRLARENPGLRVLSPSLPGRTGEVELARLGCAVIPPRRFVEKPTVEGEALFRRTSFCAFEGTEFFAVQRTGDLPLDPVELRRHAEVYTRRDHDDGEVRDVGLVVEDLAPIDGRAQVLVIAEGTSDVGPRRNTLRWFLDDAGRPWYLAIYASPAIPTAVRVLELDEAVRSWRRVFDGSGNDAR